MTSNAPETTAAAALADIEVRLSECEGGCRWRDLFGGDGPIEIEVGCGKGRFLISRAQSEPDRNFLGIERSRKFLRVMRDRTLRAGLTNIRLLCAEAAYFLQTYVPPESVQACYVFFPDPWPKKRHHKRRLVNPAFAATVRSALQPGGVLHLATDHAEYFQQMLQVCRNCAGLEETLVQRIDPADAEPEQARTNYERKYLLQGRPVYNARYTAT